MHTTDRNEITMQEYQATAFPQFYKSVDEYCAPLTDPNSAVHQAGLRLVSAETRIVECPYARRFQQDGDVDADDFNFFLQAYDNPLLDCNSNAQPDLLDILLGETPDSMRDCVQLNWRWRISGSS